VDKPPRHELSEVNGQSLRFKYRATTTEGPSQSSHFATFSMATRLKWYAGPMVRADEVVVRHEPTVVVHEHYAHHYTHQYAHHDVVVGCYLYRAYAISFAKTVVNRKSPALF
jgi:hypothetical protein